MKVTLDSHHIHSLQIHAMTGQLLRYVRTSVDTTRRRALFKHYRDASCEIFSCKARHQKIFAPFWKKHQLVSSLTVLRTFQHPYRNLFKELNFYILPFSICCYCL